MCLGDTAAARCTAVVMAWPGRVEVRKDNGHVEHAARRQSCERSSYL